MMPSEKAYEIIRQYETEGTFQTDMECIKNIVSTMDLLKSLNLTLNQNQFDALCSLGSSIGGAEGFQNTMMLYFMKNQFYEEMADAFISFEDAPAGRREAERALYLLGI